jgi:acyl carrier protein
MDRQQRITAVVKRVAGNDKDPAPDEALFETGYLDSFGLPDLVADLEKEFGVKIPDSDLRPANFSSVEKIETYLEGKGS